MNQVLAVIFIFGSAVIIHELGHFILAKLSGIKVHEFAVGMGPKLFSYKKGETDYSLRALPLGGFVKMEGEDEKSSDKRAFNNKPVLSRFMVILAGPLMNFILAIILFSIVMFIAGVSIPTINTLTSGFPAEAVGLQPGDKILAINDTNIRTWDQVVTEIGKNDIKEMTITVERDNKKLNFNITPIENEETGQIMIGISPVVVQSVTHSISTGFLRVITTMNEMIYFLRQLIVGRASTGTLVGPVGIIQVAGQAAKYGILNVINLAAFISINLGIINLLPIPALDGSRLVFLGYEALRGKPVKQEREAMIHFIGFVFLIGLMIVITFRDVSNIL